MFLTLALAPVVALVIFIYYRDKHDREPFFALLRAFLAGAVCVIPAALLEYSYGKAEDGGLLQTAYFTFFIIAGAEEGCKYLFMRWASYNKRSFNEPFDGIVYCVMVGMGFAALENVLYVYQSEDPLFTALMRSITAVPAHFTFGVIMGYFVGLAKFNPGKSVQYRLMGVGAAMFFHGFYDFFLMQNVIPNIAAGAFISLIVAWRLSLKAMRMQIANSKSYLEAKQTNEVL